MSINSGRPDASRPLLKLSALTGLFIGLLASILFCYPGDTHAVTPVQVDVLYMNHPPMQPTIKQLKELFSKYGGKITVSWHDLDTKEAQQFMAKKGIHEHVPLSIWIDGSQSAKLGKKTIQFARFPAGSGPEGFQGDWTMQDLKNALEAISGRR